ncbi:xanthine dehydrogenase/oxidase-like [Culex pipiens pallens]|uniref:xanthine dehydrogenase/oxidase-like n=1 Tax=Culex pipiens pallens TaxID=42434 RepID=UPI001953E1D2|nr:xanthine dehydrogenase/oxidase-like [Culex pipiens pallens]
MFSSLSSYIWESTEVQSPIEKVTFTINKKTYEVNSSTIPVDTSLNTFIRQHAHLTGTKFMCLEGGCGACVVNVSGPHPVTKKRTTLAVNSCLLPVLACHGLDILTVEGLGNKADGYHPAQLRLAHFNGTQCGYCTPGMVMSMYSLLEAKEGRVTMAEVEDSFGGNICRCTGYRSILDAFKSLAVDASEKLLDACRDIEDLGKVCPKSGQVCAGSCSAVQQPIRMIFEDQTELHKVCNVSGIFTIFNQIGNKPYMLIAGNTAHGVYRRSDQLQVFIDVNSVYDLHTFALNEKLTIGANVSLAEFITILKTTANRNSNFSYCEELADHISMVANIPVRNIGTIAGNLMIKNQHNEFPSDCFLVLDAVGATLTIAESNEGSSTVHMQDFIAINMTKKVIKNVALPALDPTVFVFKSFKVMPTVQNARAYVNGAFLIKFNASKDRVESARICFGGINPKFTHAVATENLLIGKNLFDNNTLQAALGTLANELDPDWILPDTSIEYRKNLAVSLFYKFVLSIVTEDGRFPLRPAYKSGGQMLQRPLSSGKQSFDTIEKNWPLTKYVPKIEALPQTTGEAQFINDLAPQPGELFAAVVLATEVHSKIVGLDASEALKLPGVELFYSAKDIPGINNFVTPKLPFTEVEEIFCSGEILFHSHPVGLILAETFELAQKAAKLVRISYEKVSDRPVYATVKMIMDNDNRDRFVESATKKSGELSATKIVKGRLELAGQYHYHMETQTCICVPLEDGLDVYSSTQWMDLVQIAIADSLLIPMNSINVRVRRLGGSYGGKALRATQVACACALAAHLSRRTVRLVLPMETNMAMIGKRIGNIADYNVEVDQNGKIIKLVNRFVQDYGSSVNDNIQYMVSRFFGNCYDSKGWDNAGKSVKTDAPSNTWCRAPGSTEGVAMIENIMEHIAHETGLCPLDVRMINLEKDHKMHQLIPQFRKDIQYDVRKRAIEDFNTSNRWKKRGIAVVPAQFITEYLGVLSTIVSVFYGDGTVAVTHGGIEMGQGINTKVAQVTAFALGIPLEKVSVKPAVSFVTPNNFATGSSITSEAVCYTAKKACEILLERMQPIRKDNPNASWETIVQKSYAKHIDLCAEAASGQGEIPNYLIPTLSCAELEMDILTGNVQVLRVDVLEDVGESISPGIDVGQIEGAMVMGIGYYLTEALVYDVENGALLTNRSWNYKPPGAKDIPVDFRINFLRGSSNPLGVLRSKATAEPPFNTTVVVLFALRNALRSARKDAGLPDVWIPLGVPTTPDKTFLLAGNTVDQYLLN